MGVGRPKKNNAKNSVIAMRVEDETGNKLAKLCEKYEVSKADLLKKWVDRQYVMMQNGIELL